MGCSGIHQESFLGPHPRYKVLAWEAQVFLKVLISSATAPGLAGF